MDKKVIPFDSIRKKDPKIPVVDIGTIYIDLLLSCDGNNIYFRPSYELEYGLSDEILERYSRMLKKNFSEAVDLLFEHYRSNP